MNISKRPPTRDILVSSNLYLSPPLPIPIPILFLSFLFHFTKERGQVVYSTFDFLHSLLPGVPA